MHAHMILLHAVHLYWICHWGLYQRECGHARRLTERMHHHLSSSGGFFRAALCGSGSHRRDGIYPKDLFFSEEFSLHSVILMLLVCCYTAYNTWMVCKNRVVFELVRPGIPMQWTGVVFITLLHVFNNNYTIQFMYAMLLVYWVCPHNVMYHKFCPVKHLQVCIGNFNCKGNTSYRAHFHSYSSVYCHYAKTPCSSHLQYVCWPHSQLYN